MPQIQGFRVQNYRVLRDVTLGRLRKETETPPLTPLVAVIGKNGSGKSTLFDAFGFLKDCLEHGVEEACELKQRGGFQRLRSAGVEGPIAFEIHYKDSRGTRFAYELTIDADAHGRPTVQREVLRQRLAEAKWAWLLNLAEGAGYVGANPDEDGGEVSLSDSRRLGIATLGQLRKHPRIAAFRKFLEGWYLSYFTPDAARGLPLAGPQRRLNTRGDNLGNVVQFMQREHPEEFAEILKKIAKKIPGVRKIGTKRTVDGRLLLQFNDRGFADPFFAQQVSDGTLKLFAYLLLLEDPDPPPFLCIEEPENGLYHRLLETLAHEFRRHATGGKGASQIFVTTHQPYFVDALDPTEVWILEKQKDGFAAIRHAADDPVVVGLAKEGLPLGGLWYSQYLDKD